MNYLSQASPKLFKDKYVLLRTDMNVPIVDGIVSFAESYRIDQSMQTINYLHTAGAKLIIITHIGRDGETLLPVAHYIQKNYPTLELQFVGQVTGTSVTDTVTRMNTGDVVMLENLRSDRREETADEIFAHEFVTLTDYYVDDAFAVMHRNHTSITTLPELMGSEKSFAGLLVETELQNLEPLLSPISPSIVIMAGIKFETKLPLIEKLLPIYNYVLLGGGLLNSYLRAMNIYIADSVYDSGTDLSHLVGNEKIIIPEQVIITRDNEVLTISINEVQPHDMIVDIVLSEKMRGLITDAKTILWNGPLGWYEHGYVTSSREIAELCNPENQTVIIGGGDTVTLLRSLKLENHTSFISTGGGAMLDYLQSGTLVGIDALE